MANFLHKIAGPGSLHFALLQRIIFSEEQGMQVC